LASDASLAIDPDAEAQYNIRRRHPESPGYYERYDRESAAARASLSCELDVPYGPGPNETVDLFPAAGAGNPLLIFIHGGYWRALDKRDFSFVAPAFVAAGTSVALVNYALAPAVTVPDIVDQALRAVGWLHGHAGRLRADPARIVVSGHSAGAHLAAMALRADRLGAGWGLRGGICLSGVYDLVALVRTSVNGALRLDAAAAAAVSPAHMDLPAGLAPMLALVGGGESDGFVAQTTAFAPRWERLAPGSSHAVLPDLNHYTIMLELGRAGSPVHAAARAFLRDVA